MRHLNDDELVILGIDWAGWPVFLIGVVLGALHDVYVVARYHQGRQQAGDHTKVVQLHLRYGMILFIASEVMFFVAWFWAFLRGLTLHR